MSIIVVLFVTLANLKQSIYQKTFFLKIKGIYKKNIVFKTFFFFYIFCSAFIKSLLLWMSSNISIGTVMKNAEMIKLVPDHLKTKKVCKQARSS